MNELLALPIDTQQVVQDLLANRWSPTRISRHLRKLGHPVTVSEVGEQQEALEEFGSPDVYIDSYDEMGRVLRMVAERLEHTETLVQGDPSYIAAFQKTAKDYFAMLQEYALLGLKLGEIPEATEIPDDGRQTQRMTVQEVLAVQQKVEVQINLKE